MHAIDLSDRLVFADMDLHPTSALLVETIRLVVTGLSGARVANVAPDFTSTVINIDHTYSHYAFYALQPSHILLTSGL